MGGLLFVGCLCLAYGPAAALFIAIVLGRAHLLLSFFTSAFFWLIAAFVAALIYLIPPLQGVFAGVSVISVLLQEGFRFLFVHLYMRAERFLREHPSAPRVPNMNDLSSSVASGLGFGIMSSVIMYGTMISAAQGSASLYLPSCSHMSLFVFSSLESTFSILLAVILMVIAFDALRRKSYVKGAGVVLTHLLFSLLTLMNEMDGGCVAIVICHAAMILIGTLCMIGVVHAPDYAARAQVKRSQGAL